MQYRVFDIDYDTDGQDVDLPSELIFEADGIEDPASELADLVSDKTGWCVNHFEFQAVPETSPIP